MWFPYWEEAIRRMDKRGVPSVRWHLADGRIVEYRRISASEADFFEGRTAIQQKITEPDGRLHYADR